MASTPKDLQDLWNTIQRIYGFNTNRGLIEKQINSFVKDFHYTYSGINYTLIYWHDIKQKEPMPENGIKIVASVYAEAREYKYQMYKAHEVNKNKDLVNINKHINNVFIGKPESKKIKTQKDIEIENFLNKEEEDNHNE